MPKPIVALKPGREKSLLQRHPWVFSGAIRNVSSFIRDGEIIDLHSAQGRFLAQGYYNSHSQIAVRILTFSENEEIDTDFFHRRIQRAHCYRQTYLDLGKTDAYRLIHSEGDYLPGLIADKYEKFLVVQVLTLGMEKLKNLWLPVLKKIGSFQGIYERSDLSVRSLEGLPERTEILVGEVPDQILIEEDGIQFWIDIKRGQKTGFFLDQRLNRKMVGLYGQDRRCLNTFGYTGGFSLHLLKNNASSVLHLDSSSEANRIAFQNAQINGVASRLTIDTTDAFEGLRAYVSQKKSFDLIVLDPPAFAKSMGAIRRAARGYKDLNFLAFKLLNPGGILATFSCSYHIDAKLFRQIVWEASIDAQRDVKILQTLQASPDHTCNLNFPEGDYLKGLLLVIEE
jgi:23S rRNA (cytosine1962-C5)-methyltransferase